MTAENRAQNSSLATRRTWREDTLVVAALFLVLIVGLAVFSPHPQSPSNHEPVGEDPVAVAIPADPGPATPEGPTDVPPEEPAVEEPTTAPPEQPVPADNLIPTSPAFITLFGTGRPERMWYVANYDTTGGFWRNDFREDNIQTGIDGMTLAITEEAERPERPWDSGEIGTRKKYGYGRYEVVMSPAKGQGLISSFFTFTGPYFDDPHDEIDIEFLGRNTRQVELNMFAGGRSQGAKVVDLPFDAADALHLYAIEWFPDEIIWYVDNVVIHRVTSEEHTLPSHPGKIMMNLWTGKMNSWHGRADFEPGTSAVYACVAYQPFGGLSRMCSDFYRPQLNYRYDAPPS